MNKLELIKVTSKDRVYFKKWWHDKELIELTSRNFKPLSDNDFEKYFKAMLNSKSNHYYMILLDGRVVGNVSLVKSSNDFYEVQIVIGEKDFWNQGIGTLTLDSLLILAEKKKIKKIKLAVRPENKRAINLYKKFNFVEYRKTKEYIYMKKI
jgi:RimJ/RimL family protein N-acetyltransferase